MVHVLLVEVGPFHCAKVRYSRDQCGRHSLMERFTEVEVDTKGTKGCPGFSTVPL